MSAAKKRGRMAAAKGRSDVLRPRGRAERAKRVKARTERFELPGTKSTRFQGGRRKPLGYVRVWRTRQRGALLDFHTHDKALRASAHASKS